MTNFKIICFAIAILLSACSRNQGGPPPVFVETAVAKPYAWQPEIYATGTLFAEQGVMIKTELEGRIVKIFFTPGQTVAKDTPLVLINPDIYQAQLEQANAQAVLAENDFKRGQSLYKKHYFSKADLDKAEAAFHSSKAAVESAQAKLSQARIVAPFTGQMGLNKVNVGDYASAGQDIAQLQALDPLRVDFSVPEIYVGQFDVGHPVWVKSKAFPDQTFVGKVTARDSVIDPTTRSIAVRANVPNKEGKLLPGAFAEVTLFVGKLRDLVLIPQVAVVSTDKGSFVYKVVENIANKTPVKVGQRINNEEIIIEEGLKPADVVVTAGQMKIFSDKAPIIARNEH